MIRIQIESLLFTNILFLLLAKGDSIDEKNKVIFKLGVIEYKPVKGWEKREDKMMITDSVIASY